MKIGSKIEIDRPLALAPMEDVSDVGFRALCREHGADLVYTEFTHVEALARDVPSALKKIAISEAERPVAIQIYGSNGESLAAATEIVNQAGPDFIDINCGCWVKKIAQRGDGAGLLRDLKRFEFVVRSVLDNTSLPVTVKTRLGWDENSIVIEDVARMLEGLGVAALTVHCRTRRQGYTGSADWDWLGRIKAVSNVPLIGNGDVNTPRDAAEMLARGADGVMIGRGAIANPWIFRQIRHYLDTGEELSPPTLAERIELCLRHLRSNAALRGEPHGVRSFRKHYAGYLKGVRNIVQLRKDLMRFEQIAPIADLLWKFHEQNQTDVPAMECA